MIVQLVHGEETYGKDAGKLRVVIDFYMDPKYAVHPKGAARVYEKLLNQFEHVERRLGKWQHRGLLITKSQDKCRGLFLSLILLCSQVQTKL